MLPDELTCAVCGRTGTASDVAAGWSLTRPPRATGRTGPRMPAEEQLTMLCPNCARRYLRELEARLDP